MCMWLRLCCVLSVCACVCVWLCVREWLGAMRLVCRPLCGALDTLEGCIAHGAPVFGSMQL